MVPLRFGSVKKTLVNQLSRPLAGTSLLLSELRGTFPLDKPAIAVSCTSWLDSISNNPSFWVSAVLLVLLAAVSL